MIDIELGTTWLRAALVVLSSAAMLLGTIAYIRLAGLRSLSKMSSFDFVVTVAFGSVLASVAMSGSSLLDGLLATGTLLGVQVVVALGRFRGLDRLVDNRPKVLMVGDRILTDQLEATRVTEADLRAKLREANVTRFDQVAAVVLETTGDISVLHHCDGVDPGVLEGVEGAELVPGRAAPR